MTQTTVSPEEHSALDAARQLNIDLNRLYMLLRLGRVAGRKVNGQWRIPASAIEDRLRERAVAARGR